MRVKIKSKFTMIILVVVSLALCVVFYGALAWFGLELLEILRNK